MNNKVLSMQVFLVFNIYYWVLTYMFSNLNEIKVFFSLLSIIVSVLTYSLLIQQYKTQTKKITKTS